MLKNNLQTSASKIQELRKKEEGIPTYCSFKIVYQKGFNPAPKLQLVSESRDSVPSLGGSVFGIF